MIPMLHVYKKAQNDNEDHIVLAVCSILFGAILGAVSGILLIVSNVTKK
jgi:hypothetical protein